jgi:hypothetical protein
VSQKTEEEIKHLLAAIGREDKPFRDYVERRIKGQVCSLCGSTEVAYVLRGMPTLDQVLELLLLQKKIILGGCIVSEGDKDLYCYHCDLEFVRQKLNVRKEV